MDITAREPDANLSMLSDEKRTDTAQPHVRHFLQRKTEIPET